MKKKMNRVILCIFILIFSLIPIGYCDELIEEYVDMNVFSQDSTTSSVKKIAPRIVSRAVIAMDTITGRVLFEKNAYIQRPMASTTKIMTALLAIEKGNLNDVVTISVRSARVGGSSAHLYKGEKIKLNNLLYGLMLPSGNDAAIAIAEHIGGSVENFAQMMTLKAKEIGANNTAFVTPHGLDKPGHFTTAYDLALITKYALENKKFSQLVGTHQASIPGYEGSVRKYHNTNEMLRGYWGADGVKTGYTGKAGRCLVTSATRNNWRVLSVVLGSDSRNQRASDSTKILNYVFNNYEMVDLNDLIKIKSSVYVKKGKEDILNLSIDQNIPFPLRKDEIEQLRIRYDLPPYISAPIEKGIKIGTVTYSIGNSDCKRIDLFAPQRIKKKGVIDYTGDVYRKWIEIMRFRLTDVIM